jgi:hypothetical protein
MEEFTALILDVAIEENQVILVVANEAKSIEVEPCCIEI